MGAVGGDVGEPGQGIAEGDDAGDIDLQGAVGGLLGQRGDDAAVRGGDDPAATQPAVGDRRVVGHLSDRPHRAARA